MGKKTLKKTHILSKSGLAWLGYGGEGLLFIMSVARLLLC